MAIIEVVMPTASALIINALTKGVRRKLRIAILISCASMARRYALQSPAR